MYLGRDQFLIGGPSVSIDWAESCGGEPSAFLPFQSVYELAAGTRGKAMMAWGCYFSKL